MAQTRPHRPGSTATTPPPAAAAPAPSGGLSAPSARACPPPHPITAPPTAQAHTLRQCPRHAGTQGFGLSLEPCALCLVPCALALALALVVWAWGHHPAASRSAHPIWRPSCPPTPARACPAPSPHHRPAHRPSPHPAPMPSPRRYTAQGIEPWHLALGTWHLELGAWGYSNPHLPCPPSRLAGALRWNGPPARPCAASTPALAPHPCPSAIPCARPAPASQHAARQAPITTPPHMPACQRPSPMQPPARACLPSLSGTKNGLFARPYSNNALFSGVAMACCHGHRRRQPHGQPSTANRQQPAGSGQRAAGKRACQPHRAAPAVRRTRACIRPASVPHLAARLALRLA